MFVVKGRNVLGTFHQFWRQPSHSLHLVIWIQRSLLDSLFLSFINGLIAGSGRSTYHPYRWWSSNSERRWCSCLNRCRGTLEVQGRGCHRHSHPTEQTNCHQTLRPSSSGCQRNETLCFHTLIPNAEILVILLLNSTNSKVAMTRKFPTRGPCNRDFHY